MKKHLLFIAMIALSVTFVEAQNWNYQYVKTLGGSDQNEQPVDIALDADENILHAGDFMSSTISIGSYTINHRNPGMEYGNSFIAGYSSTGDVKWAKGLTGNKSVYMDAVVNAPDNSNYVLGNFTSDTLYFGNSQILSDTVYQKLFVLNVDSEGNMNSSVKMNAIGGSEFLAANDFYVNENSNMLVAGRFSGGQLSFGNNMLLPGNMNDNSQLFIGEIDAAGNVVWAYTDSVYNNSYSGTELMAISENSNEEIIAGGILKDNITSVIGDDTLHNKGKNDLLLAKFNSSGNPAWAKNYGTMEMEEVLDVAYNADDDIFMFGKFNGDTLTIEGQELANDTSGFYASQYFLAKFNATGSLQWMKKTGIASSFTDEEWSIKTDSNDVYLMSAYVEPTLNLGNVTVDNHGEHDMLLAKFDKDGNTLWAKNFGGMQSEDWYDYEMSNNTMFLAGNLKPEMVFGLDTINKANKFGFFTAQIDLSNGNWLSVKADTTSSVSYENDFRVDNFELGNNGALYMNGAFRGSGITLDGNTLSHFGSQDVFIAKQTRNYMISGKIFDYSEQPVTSGMVYLYEFEGTGPFQVYDSTSINSNAYYEFKNLPVDKYIVKAVPDDNNYPTLASSYYNDAMTWNNAIVINTEEGSNTAAYIYLRDMPQNSGNATVQGQVTKENTKVTKTSTEITGEPVKGVSVILKGKKKADGDFYDRTTTNSQGTYEFANVDQGSYSIMVDLPGMKQAETYDLEVSEGQTSYENYDYVMEGDTIFIADTSAATGIGNQAEEVSLKIYPNPASNYLYMETKESDKLVRVQMHTVNGQTILTKNLTGHSRFRLNLEGVEEGIYFIQIQTTSGELVRRMIVQ